VPVGIILVDARSGGTTYANRHAERILGRTLNDTERPISTVDLTAWRPDGSIVEAERLLVSRALRGDCAVREDLARVREDGSTVQIRATAVPIHDDEGRAAAVVLALDDTTDEWLARTERDANERFRELFIGMLGHDLRSPLSSVVTGACVLRRAGDLNATQERTVERLERAGERMGRMVEQMLDFARSRLGGGIPVVCRPTSMHDLVRAIVAEVQPEQGPSRIDLELEGDGEGEWDPDRLGQVVANLVGNALTHGAQDGRVSVRVRGEPGSVTLQVHNDGPPIPENLLPVMFDPFRRAEVNGRGQGLGLGLYIAKQIVHAHGGALTVESSADAGTTFTVTLPRCVHRA
jgi:PAS domain S-box-containing protein